MEEAGAIGRAMVHAVFLCVYTFYLWMFDLAVGQFSARAEVAELRAGHSELHAQLAASIGARVERIAPEPPRRGAPWSPALQVVVGGPAEVADAPLLVLVHGFPENWAAFLDVMRRLLRGGGGGAEVVAMNLRGYGLSDASPARLEDVSLDRLAADVARVIDHFDPPPPSSPGKAAGRPTKRRRVVLAGHDWGAAVAWAYAALHPGRLSSLVVLNGPHPVVFRRSLLDGANWVQAVKSWYVVAFAAPAMPESWFGLNPLRVAHSIFYLTARNRAWLWREPRVVRLYAAGWASPDHLATQINYYRCALTRQDLTPRLGRVDVPVHVVWGLGDEFLDYSHVRRLQAERARWCPDLTVHPVPDCGHWVTHEAPSAVLRVLRRALEHEPPSTF